MTLRGIDESMAKMLKELAAKEGMRMNAFLLKTLREALRLGKKRRGAEYHDLDELAGTWKAEDAVEFEKSTAPSRWWMKRSGSDVSFLIPDAGCLNPDSWILNPDPCFLVPDC